MKMWKKYSASWIMFFIFESVAILLWLSQGDIFYLFNFTYIGGFIAGGLALYANHFRYARHIMQLGIGLYMLVYVGFICHENMQIEGFWYYLFSGVFEGATIHYLIAKIFGPLFFGRAWCSYACWTAMVLDFLPYQQPSHQRKPLGFLRYVVFGTALLYVGLLFFLRVPNMEKIMFWSFVLGNILYYAIGIAMAFIWKDNRAFCKYFCPVTVFLKPASYFAYMRIKVDANKCISCGKCKQVCPMDVDVLDPKRSRENGTECILCMKCVDQCPVKAIDV